MADKTTIEWTDATWNPITGCSRVSKGCEHCYAETLAAGRLRHHPSRAGLTDENGRWNGVVRLNKEWLWQPLGWRKPRRIFVVAHGDLFHERVPDKWIDGIFSVMSLAPQHIFQVLTKRPERMRQYIKKAAASGIMWPLPNVWLGTSVENQETADERIPHLMETPAAVRWLSAEPLLAPITFDSTHESDMVESNFLSGIAGERVYDGRKCALDWVVCGGESGPGFRPMKAGWARSIRDQCALAGIPFFMKQMAGKAAIPDDLLIREYPNAISLERESGQVRIEGTS